MWQQKLYIQNDDRRQISFVFSSNEQMDHGENDMSISICLNIRVTACAAWAPAIVVVNIIIHIQLSGREGMDQNQKWLSHHN